VGENPRLTENQSKSEQDLESTGTMKDGTALHQSRQPVAAFSSITEKYEPMQRWQNEERKDQPWHGVERKLGEEAMRFKDWFSNQRSCPT
jgi:hypothetical protein